MTMATTERTLTINIRREIMKVPAYKRAKKAVAAVRQHLQQHMKASEENVKIGKYLNLKLWEHGIKKPITRITVIAKKDDKGIVTAELPNIPVKKQNEKRAEKAAASAAKKKGKAEKAPPTPAPAGPAPTAKAPAPATKTE